MAAGRTTFEKLQRDRAKKAKAEAKRAKRMGKIPQSGPLVAETDEPDGTGAVLDGNLDEELSAADLIRLVEEVQNQFDNDEISYDEDEQRKTELLGRLPSACSRRYCGHEPSGSFFARVTIVKQVTPPTTARVSRQAWKVLGATALTNFVVGLDLSITNVAVPDIGREFISASTADTSWVLTFYMVTFAGFLVVAGRWADRFGRLRMLNIGITCFVVGAGLAALAPSLPVLIVMRGLQGVGAAMMAPASLGLAVAAWPIERRGTAVAVWSSTLALSTAVGPVVGGLLIEYGSWRWAYALNVPVAIVALVWGIRVLTESVRQPEAGTPDLVGAALLGGATGGLALAIVQGQEWGWASPAVLGLLVMCAASIVAVARRSARHPAPIVPRALLAVSSFRIAFTSLFLFGLGFFASLLAMVLYFTDTPP